MRQTHRLFKCAKQIYSHGKLSRGGILSPLKTLRYMAAFVIIMGHLLNWDVLIYQWFYCKSFPVCDDSFNSSSLCVLLILFFFFPLCAHCYLCAGINVCVRLHTHVCASMCACSGWYMSCDRIARALSTAAGCHSHLRGPMSLWELMYSDILWDFGSPQRD